jgi:thioredoxin 1
MSNVINAGKADFEKVVLQSELPVLVDFWAPWCRPCQMMAPVLDEVSVEAAGKLSVVKVDVDNPENAELGARYEIRSIPNLKLFKGGVVIAEVVGLRSKAELLAELAGKY